VTSLRERPGDWLFVLAFSFFAFSSCFSDAVVTRGVPLAPDSPSFWARANWWYANGTDPLLFHPPIGFRMQTGVSAFVFGPFYLVLVYAFLTGRDWIRMPALLYVSAMVYGMVIVLGTEFLGDEPPTNVPKFLAFNLPYLFVPLLLGWRMRHPRPFAARNDRLRAGRAAAVPLARRAPS
jgi:emopamil binding protein